MLDSDSSLAEVRAFTAAIAETLDPKSRYLPELLATVDASRDTRDLVAHLAVNSRGARHAGANVFARMSVEQKIRCNLITNETVLFRFGEGEWDTLQKQVARFAGLPDGGRILCAPCSHGEEAFSLAAACLQAGVKFTIDACDIQPECIAEAARGRMAMGFPDAYLETPAIVQAAVLEKIRFATGDLFLVPGAPGAVPAGPFDLVVCRNFLGYFRGEIAERIAGALASLVRPGSAASDCEPGVGGPRRPVAVRTGSTGATRAGVPAFSSRSRKNASPVRCSGSIPVAPVQPGG